MIVPVKEGGFLLPKKHISLEKWATIACDQHTSDKEYWDGLTQFVGDSPSTLNLVFPEYYLERVNKDKQIDTIASAMKSYLDQNIFDEYFGMIKVERKLSNGKTRKGLLLLIDLEHYSFYTTEKPLIMASENTVLGRLPIREQLRVKSSLETAHVLALYEDKEFTVQSAVQSAGATPLYDFDLNFDGGNIKGSLIKDCKGIISAFGALIKQSVSKYNQGVLFLVGDGNHSLASAKNIYKQLKANGSDTTNCRYAMVEAVNIYDEALDFEPIHRLAFTDGNQEQFLKDLYKDMPDCPIETVRYTDDFIDKRGFSADYVHGTEHLNKLAKELNAAAVHLKKMNKDDLFEYIISKGVLPKKTFSLGEAQDKRYYLEVKKIT